ncbi:MAG: SDR family oxidoreductase [Gammaproteobacteria bacterium]|nr:SDR family oxidoreductase [Gammaproteobacteria bacterium]
MSSFTDKHIVITGGTKGIGFATAERFARQGAKVLITGTSQSSVDAALASSKESLQGTVCDLASMADIDALAEKAGTELGRVDILFANAGLAHFQPLEKMTEALYDEMMDVNVKGLYFSIQKLVPLMGEGGVIVVTASIAPRKGQAGMAVYGASKGAARGMVRSLAAELLEKGIRVNCISPGPVPTNIFSRMTGGDEAQSQAIIDKLAESVPLGRVGKAEEMAAAVEFMCSDGAAYMIGSELTLDGGKAEL